MLKRHLPFPIVLRLLCCMTVIQGALGGPASTSTITLTSSGNPSIIGQPLTLTASVTAGATGQVTFYDSGLILGIAPIASGQAKLTTRLLPVGMRSLRAHYSGDPTYLPSDSVPLTQTVVSLPANNVQQVFSPLNLGFSIGGSGAMVSDFNSDGKEDLSVLDNLGNVDVFLGKGDGTFQAPTVTTSPVQNTNVNASVVGDFNGDGVSDLAVIYTSFASGNEILYILLGKGDGSFRTGASLSFPGSSGYTQLAAADFNGDGNADLVLSSGSGSGFLILLGNGDGTFQTSGAYNTGGGPVTVADLNVDGKPDLIFGNGMLVVLLGNGDGTFRGPTTDLSLGNSGGFLAGDVNGDGKPDLVGTGSPTILLLLGNGDGTFQKPIHVGDSFTFFNGSVIGDFNGDGQMDLLGTMNSNVVIWLGNGDGTFQPPAIQSNGAGFPGSLAIGEFNGDGRTDFALITGFSSNTITAFLETAVPDLTLAESHGGSFVPGTTGETFTITVGNLQFAPTAGTVTVADALPSGVSATAISGTGWNCTLATLTCTRSDSLPPSAVYPAIVIAVSIAGNVPSSISNVVTLSGGGMTAANKKSTDTIITRTTTTLLAASPNPASLGQAVTLNAAVTASVPVVATGQITFYDGATVLGVSPLASGQASFTAKSLAAGTHALRARYDPDASTLLPPSISLPFTQSVTELQANGFQPVAAYPAAAPSNSVVMADLNGDGKADLVVAGGSVLSVLLGNGDGTFRGPVNSTAANTGLVTSLPVMADFNGDGKPDLVLAYQDPSNSGGGGVNVLLGNGDGTFQPPSPFTVGTTVSSLVLADFNGDGNADIAFGGNGGGLTLLLGKGNGIFQLPVSVTLNGFSGGFAAADLNGDGKADLVYVSFNGISTQLGNGDGTFQAPVSTQGSVCCSPIALVLGDFNGDGKVDVAVGSFGLLVFLGNGDGTFQTSKGVTTGLSNLSVTTGDLNGDGYADLIVAGPGNAITELLSKGDGTFQTPIVVPTGGAAAGMAIGDLNSDGRADIAVANGTNGNVGILLGGQFAPPTRINLTVWRPSNGTWYVNPSNRPVFNVQWGLSGDIPVAADFDHDGQLDYAVWRPALGNWYINLTSDPGVPQIRQWGLPGDIPVAGDYDGDGKADFAVWRPSNATWYVLRSLFGNNPTTKQWGLPNDVPIVADFDGDGKVDYAVWRPSEGNWYISPSGSNTTIVKQWGLTGDIPVAADFDGDGKADYAIWRPAEGNWYITLSSSGATVVKQWGLPGDIPVPRDYDGDGKADFAVWRPSNGTWYIIPSANPTAAVIVPWGLPSDIPIYKPAGN